MAKKKELSEKGKKISKRLKASWKIRRAKKAIELNDVKRHSIKTEIHKSNIPEGTYELKSQLTPYKEIPIEERYDKLRNDYSNLERENRHLRQSLQHCTNLANGINTISRSIQNISQLND